ncbi:hypothetical protein CANTEDRAFT_98473 [Yamadazyma tenuis ATCC 10573]|uniref:Uncharacterized protein n=1 Tax=Candida tenuis (strain ATCC 10573 / BCRC 21748 / CBS 615 / JCM 9827 / NBRC 10315 / NRRL Y-1498 / VKM Y-70) TaxID=590646 RepID=G3B5Y9_CANTC|nr:uncharacterized protein CANTEDRAFT_98473 [Yamadazyma tenuis ATCC 10573]EGV63335.1 hypothetical protein CANTEDRAFT_98473 [Yamadazyma tenuis ATCC 10573]
MPGNQSHFEELESFDVSFAPVKITKWRSYRTGLQVCYIDQPSPIVQGYFAVATEIPDDSGCPHTLEHLVFMGSQKYPYKGYLDTLGNRFYSSTNAWTSVDQTVYNITTAGWEGFKTLLPIYLEHILYPTLTDEACLTEVYHVDGKGEEKGVVFCEMQGYETQPTFQLFLKMQRTLYAKESGYSSETGGLMSELRNLTNEQIREFHKSLYRPDNLCVIITGSIDEEEMLKIMSDFDSELPLLPSKPNKRPFVDSVHDERLKESLVEEFEFPEKDESMGEILISWIGPKYDDSLTYEALEMLGYYFTENANSLFNKNFIEVENPLANEVYHSYDNYWNTGINYVFSGVPSNRLKELDEKVKKLIKEQAKPENFKLDFMKQIIRQQRLSLIFDCEKKPTHFQTCAVLDFLYSPVKSENLKKWANCTDEYDTLLTWKAEQWCQIIEEYLVKNHSATLLGKPSAELNKRIKLENKKTKEDRIAKYGEEGLKQLEEKLDKAKTKNDQPIPEELLVKFGKPDPSKINFIETKSYKQGQNDLVAGYETSGSFQDKLDADKLEENPLFFHFEDFKSQFITIHLVMSTKDVDKELLRYLSIMEEIFNMAITLPDGTYIPYEKVINTLNDDLIEFELDNGFDGQFLEFIHIKVKCEFTKYKAAVDWMYKIMTMNTIEKDRIKVIVEKIINALPEKKRSGELMMYSKQFRTLFTNDSTRRAQDPIYNEEFYKQLLDDIENDKFDKIKQDLSAFKKQLFTLNNFKVFVNGGCEQIVNPVSSWLDFIKAFEPTNELIPIKSLPRSHQFRSEIGLRCSKNVYAVTIAAIESSNLVTLTKIPVDYLEDDIFKIALASEYLNAVEGPLWRGLRGTGLCYGTSVSRNIETGYLNYSIYSSTDVEQAWSTSKKIISHYGNGTSKFEKSKVEDSISAIMNGLANGQSNLFDASMVKVADNVFRNRGPNYRAKLVAKLKTITEEELVSVMNKYFKKLFEPEHSIVFTSIPSSKGEQVQSFFQKEGYEVEIEEVSNEDLELESEEEETESEGSSDESDSGSDLE